MTPQDYLKHWDKYKVWRNIKFPRHQRRLKQCASYLKGNTFLDVGCVYGHSTNELRKFKKGNWAGLDFVEKAVIEGRKLFPDISFYFSSSLVVSTGLGGKTFDSVVCSEVIEHIEDDKLFVNELIKITKKVLVITTPCVKVSDPGHLRLYTEKTLRQLFKRYNVNFYKVSPFFYVVVNLQGG